MRFDLFVHFVTPAAENGCSEDRRPLDRIEQLQQQLLTTLNKMANQQEELDVLVEEALGMIGIEIAELKKLVEGLEPGKPLDLSKLKAIKAKIQGMSDEVTVTPSTPPAAGKHNVSFGFRSSGEEIFNIPAINNNVSDKRAAQLDAMYEAIIHSADAQASDGSAIEKTYYITNNGVTKEKSYDNEAQIAAGDVAFSEAVLSVALAQLSKFRP